jgi:glycosyltransferase involved in cell wall biosynthesis
MFEYMASSLPIIASDFPLWRSIIEKAQCGICVDPLDPYAISEAINWILSHPSEAHLMGQNGLRAVQEKYNWEQEEKKLLALYSTLLGSHQ